MIDDHSDRDRAWVERELGDVPIAKAELFAIDGAYCAWKNSLSGLSDAVLGGQPPGISTMEWHALKGDQEVEPATLSLWR